MNGAVYRCWANRSIYIERELYLEEDCSDYLQHDEEKSRRYKCLARVDSRNHI